MLKLMKRKVIILFLFLLPLILLFSDAPPFNHGKIINKFLRFESEEATKETFLSWTTAFSSEENVIYQFSAYLDNRTDTHKVRVIAASYSTQDIFCLLFDDISFSVVKATMIRQDYFHPKYTTLYITCESNPDSLSPPHSVSLVLHSDLNSFPHNESQKYTIPIQPVIVRKKNKENLQLGVCYQPIHNHGLSHQLMDMHIQVLRALEVDKFVIYYDRDALGPEYLQLIDYYISEGIVVGVNWKLFADPKTETDTIAVWGQYAQTVDCYYRFMKDFDFILNVDFDEFAVPQNDQSWKEYFLGLSEEIQSETSHMLVPNTYVKTQPFKNKSIPEMVKIFSGPNTTVMQDCPLQEKYFYDPAKIVWGFIHFPLEVMPGFRSFRLDKSLVRMYHMKTSLEGYFVQCKHKDENGLQFLADFLKNMKFRT